MCNIVGFCFFHKDFCVLQKWGINLTNRNCVVFNRFCSWVSNCKSAFCPPWQDIHQPTAPFRPDRRGAASGFQENYHVASSIRNLPRRAIRHSVMSAPKTDVGGIEKQIFSVAIEPHRKASAQKACYESRLQSSPRDDHNDQH